jgi:beta-N-acetylhexosaminidase
MLSWAIYPALDPSLPAGLSPTVIGGELRRRLGYRGVTVTDSLEAGALDAFGGPAERAAAAAAAGADLLLCSARTVDANSPLIGIGALHGLASSIASGEADRPSAEQAAARFTAAPPVIYSHSREKPRKPRMPLSLLLLAHCDSGRSIGRYARVSS